MRVLRNITGLFITSCLCFACSLKEDVFIPQTNDGVLQLNAAVADYSVHNVSTKAADTDINELTMLIFTAAGEIVGRPVNIPGSNPTFLIDTKEKYIWDPNAVGADQMIPITNGDDALHECDIYMVANSWETLKNHTDIQTLDELLEITLPVSGIGVPENGFPMIGKQDEGTTFDLAKNKVNSATDGNTLATITMMKLYSMVNVRIRVIADQVVATPSFTLTDWQVCNIPSVVQFGEPTGGATTPNTSYIAESQKSAVLTAGDKQVEHTVSGSDYFEFSFYMPEHHLYPLDAGGNKITKENWGKYPTGITEDAYQRYKPLLCNDTQSPTYVKVHGSYKDHQGNAKEVTYDIYLGQNPVDDFCVKRNQLLNNTVTIKGATDRRPDAYPDGYDPSNDNVSIDHRVEIGSEGFVISMEREALMDSHFEVRPMDFVVSDGSKIIVAIDEDSNTDPAKAVWMRFEKSDETLATDHIAGTGVRKYFTTDLVTTTLSASENKSITITEDTRLWIYFDENTNVYDSYLDTDEGNPLPKWRDIKLKVDYYAPGNNTSTPDKPMVYTFRQWHLWRIRDTDNTRYYDIEHEEEYLYNYASDDNYGKTTDGMEWGLINQTTSSSVQAFNSTSGNAISSTVRNWIMDSMKPYYDFYITADECPIPDEEEGTHYFPYSGYQFSNKLLTKAGVGARLLNTSPESAVEYCYNKNKRTSDGSVTEMKWFLPAIDEIEHIVVGGYSDFDVFQKKYYWSSQPAYTYKQWKYESIIIGDDEGDLYEENPNYARATSVEFKGGDPNDKNNYIPVLSGDYVALTTLVQHSIFGSSEQAIEGAVADRGLGYMSRDAINRIRCVYNSGLVSEL